MSELLDAEWSVHETQTKKQGDNLFLAREFLLWTFIESYHAKFGKFPLTKSIRYIAYICMQAGRLLVVQYGVSTFVHTKVQLAPYIYKIGNTSW